MKIFNLTLHAPTPEMVDWGVKKGDLVGDSDGGGHIIADEWEFTKPMGKEIPIGVDGCTIREQADSLISEVVKLNGTAILVGGMTDMSYHLIGYAHKRNLKVFVAVTERTRDENDRFVFHFSGLRKVWKNEEVFYE